MQGPRGDRPKGHGHKGGGHGRPHGSKGGHGKGGWGRDARGERPPHGERRDASPASGPDAGPGAGRPPQSHQGGQGSQAVLDDGTVRLFGFHAVAAALANPRRAVKRLRLTDNAENRLEAEIKARDLRVERVHPRDLDRLLGADTVHQGALLETELLAEPQLADLAERAAQGGPIVVLDQVTDPHNVGAILRSAAVFGAAGLVMTRRNSPPLGGVLAKAASGALEHVPVALVTNLSRALAELAELGITRIGLDGEAEATIEAAGLAPPVALVLGSEGQGLRRLTRESCDRLARIGSSGGLASLNVSNAAAVALFVAAQAKT